MAGQEFTWNAKEGAPLDVIEALEAEHGRAPVPELIGAAVVEISSALDQLQHRYTNAEQRHGIADMVRERFLQLQRLVSRIGDAETRTRLTHYLVLVGSLGVVMEEEIFVLLEAISRRRVRSWVDQFYKASHNIAGYQMTGDLFAEMQQAQSDLLHWLDTI